MSLGRLPRSTKPIVIESITIICWSTVVTSPKTSPFSQQSIPTRITWHLSVAILVQMEAQDIVGGSSSDHDKGHYPVEVVGQSSGNEGHSPVEVVVVGQSSRAPGEPIFQNGPADIFAIWSGPTGIWSQDMLGFPGSVAHNEERCFFCGVVWCGWRMCNNSADAVFNDQEKFMHDLASGVVTSRVPLLGYIDYIVDDCAACVDMLPVGEVKHVLSEDMLQKRVSLKDGRTASVKDVVDDWTPRRRRKDMKIYTVILDDALARMVVSGESGIMHSVALTRKINRKRLLVYTHPPGKVLSRFLSATCAPTKVVIDEKTRKPEFRQDAGEALDWMEATRDIKSLRKTKRTTSGYEKLLARKTQLPKEELTLETPSGEKLRRFRVRLDCSSLLVERDDFENMVHNVPSERWPRIYVYADASPQARGLEMFASSYDLITDDRSCIQRSFPPVHLARSQLSARGKVAALLWQIFLVAGKTLGLLRIFLSCIRSITSDMGVERLLADQADCLDSWLAVAFGISPSLERPSTIFLFPNCLLTPGWRHLLDGTLKNSLMLLPWFKSFLEKLKAMSYFFRDMNKVDEMCRILRKGGKGGLASAVEKLKLTNIAEWRWSTLGKTCRRLEPLLESLCAEFDTSWCGNARDIKQVKLMDQAFKSSSWPLQFRVVSFFSDWYDPIVTWIGGCECHQAEYLAGKSVVSCWRKGRRLREAYPFALDALKAGLATANSWTSEDWDGDETILSQAQGAVRTSFALATAKIDYLHCLPWILARLDCRSVRARALELWASVPQNKHHRISILFLGASGPLRWRVDNMDESAEGLGIDSVLQRAICDLQDCGMDDTRAEGPHAEANIVMSGARAGKWSWVASTLRLDANLSNLAGLRSDRDAEPLQVLWDRYKNVLRPPGELVNPRPMWMTRRALLSKVYSCHHLRQFTDDKGGVLIKADKKDDGDDDDGYASGGDANDDDAFGGVTACEKEEIMLLREYLQDCLQPFDHISFEFKDNCGNDAVAFMQLLSIGVKNILVRAVGSKAGAFDKGMFPVTVQPLEITDGDIVGNALLKQGLPNRVDVFPFLEPEKFDMFKRTGFKLEVHASIRVWKAEFSGTGGGLCLHSSSALVPRTDAMASNAPSLTPLIALRRAGWCGVSKKVEHKDDTKTLDGRKLVGKSAYFQVLLILPELLRNEVGAIPSDQPGSYYSVLLKLRQHVAVGLGDKAYKKILSDNGVEKQGKRKQIGNGRRQAQVGCKSNLCLKHVCVRHTFGPIVW